MATHRPARKTSDIGTAAVWYPELLETVSDHISIGRRRAVAAANNELVTTYWAIGREIAAREGYEGWGAKVVLRLSADLRKQFPDAKGFSPRNLRYMRQLAVAWPDPAMLQGTLATLPWYHHIALLDKLSDAEEREWYAHAALEFGWSRDVLALQIERKVRERSGNAVSNFAATLPAEDSDLAQQATKDPYLVDFLDATETMIERELERGLMDHVGTFLVELGQGFAFVGRQVRLEVGDEDYYCDLLFYHLRLRRYVVIELKATAFKPDYLGQLGMYLAVVDDTLAHRDDQPTIGLLLCKTKNSVAAEYALRSSNAPIGVAAWTTAITSSLPDELKSSLPTIEEIEAELAGPTEQPPDGETEDE